MTKKSVLNRCKGSFIFTFVLIIFLFHTSFAAATVSYSDNLIPAMISNTSPSGIVSASDGSTDAYMIFDKNQGTGHFFDEYDPHPWITYEFPTAHVVKKVSLNWQIHNTNASFSLYGYDEQSGQWNALGGGGWLGQNQSAEFNNSQAYRKFSLHIDLDELEGVGVSVFEIGLYEESETIPNSPDNLQGVPGPNKVDLTWNPAARAEQYIVKRSTSATGTYQVLANNVTTSGYTDTTAVNGKKYYYMVSSKNSYGESANSGVLSVYLKELIPPQTTIALEGSKGPDNKYHSEVYIYLAAADNTGGSGLASVEYSTDNVNWTNTMPVLINKIWVYSHYSINQEGTTRIFYRSIDKDGNVEATKYVDIDIDTQLPEQAPPAYTTGNIIPAMTSNFAPSGVAAASDLSNDAYKAFDSNANTVWAPDCESVISYQFPNARNVSRFSIEWAMRGYIGMFNLYYDLYGYDENGQSWEKINSGTFDMYDGVSTAAFTNVKSYKKYKLQLSARDDDGAAAGIDVKEIKFYEAPYAPLNLMAAAGSNKVDLSWNVSSGAAQYIVKRSTGGNGPWQVIAANVPSTSYTDQNVVSGTTYYYVVSAMNANGESLNSNVVSATPSDALNFAETTNYSRNIIFESPKVVTKIMYTLNSLGASYILPVSYSLEAYDESEEKWITLDATGTITFGNNELVVSNGEAFKKYRLNLIFTAASDVSINIISVSGY